MNKYSPTRWGICAEISAEMRETMKRSFCVAAVLLALGVAFFVTAVHAVNGQSDDVVITENTLYGDPGTASGLNLRVTSQWQDYLVWDTVYDVENGETESDFSFYPYEKNWQESFSAGVELWMPLNWGMARTSSPSRPFDPEGSSLSEVVKAVMEKTAPGESRMETVRLSDYYEYFPLEFSIHRNDLNIYYNDDDKFYADFFHIPVPDWLILEIELEKDETGDVIALECSSEHSVYFSGAFAFGQEGCYFTFYPEDENGILTVGTGAGYGIYYVPYLTEKYGSNSIDPGQTRMLCSLPSGLTTVYMALNENLGELYLVTMEGQDYYLNVYQAEQEKLVQKGKIFVRSVSGELGEEGNPNFAQMSVHDEGVLMVWKDGSFALAVHGEEEMELWCLEQHPGSEMIFPYEHVWAFEGQRLAFASFADWESMSVELAVFCEGELTWYGACAHSGNAGSDQVSFPLRILPPGTRSTAVTAYHESLLYRRRNSVAVEELLGLEWK